MVACGLDFGTSNSAIGIVRQDKIELAPLENGATLVPTAVFYDISAGDRATFGQTAIAAYADGIDGRLMRALKSILGSALLDEGTIIGTRRIAFSDVIVTFIRHLKEKAETFLGSAIDDVVLGRPVHFVDADADADQRAEDSLAAAARKAGFQNVSFVLEPIAAAYHYETIVDREEIVLIADIGGGTSDFSVVRVGPKRRERKDRSKDILSNAGARIGGTDFDRALSLDQVMPLLGLGTLLVEKNLPMPRGIYADLAAWSLINQLYTPKAVREIEAMHQIAQEPEKTGRLVATVTQHLGHRIAFAVEQAKIELSDSENALLPLDFIERNLGGNLTRQRFDRTIATMTGRLQTTAAQCIKDAGVTPDAVQAIFFTGGSSRIPAVREAISKAAPDAPHKGGTDFLSIVLGLTEEARRRSRI